MTWQEYLVTMSSDSNRPQWQAQNYKLIRDHLVPLVHQLGVRAFMVFNYFDPAKSQDLIRYRVDANEDQHTRIESSLASLRQAGEFHDWKVQDYDPRANATSRINDSRKNLEVGLGGAIPEGWQIAGKLGGKWEISPANLDSQIDQFDTVLEKVVGQFTKTFVENFDLRPNCRWLMSLLVHLLMNSVTVSFNQEAEIREFPAL